MLRTVPAAIAAIAAAAGTTAIAASAAGTALAIGVLGLCIGCGGVDDHTAVTAFALALAAHALHLADGRVDDAALVGVHGFHGKAAAGLAHLGTNALCQCGQVALALIAVAGHIQTQLDVIALQTVCHKACQIGKALHGLAAAADEATQLFTVQTDDGSFALLHSAEGDILHAHQGNDLTQVVHSSLDLSVLFDHDGDFRLLFLGSGLLCSSFCSGGSRLFGLCFRLCCRSSRLLCHGSGLDSLLHGSLFLNNRLSGCCSRSIRLLHAHAHLSGGELQAQKTSLLGHFQHFAADIQIIGLHAQQSAGFCAGFIDRFAGRFLLTDHNRSSSSYSLSCLFSSLSGTVRSSL